MALWTEVINTFQNKIQYESPLEKDQAISEKIKTKPLCVSIHTCPNLDNINITSSISA